MAGETVQPSGADTDSVAPGTSRPRAVTVTVASNGVPASTRAGANEIAAHYDGQSGLPAIWVAPGGDLVVNGFSTFDLVQMEALLRMQQHGTQAKSADVLVAAYEVLGVSAQAANAEVTKAYRRLMNQNHPDKLVAKGLPESMMNMAVEKTRQIRAAYERICEARGMR